MVKKLKKAAVFAAVAAAAAGIAYFVKNKFFNDSDLDDFDEFDDLDDLDDLTDCDDGLDGGAETKTEEETPADDDCSDSGLL